MSKESSVTRILYVEDSKFYAQVIQKSVCHLKNVSLDYASTMEQGMRCIELRNGGYDIALVDLNLPDAPNGEFARQALKHNISTLVFSSVVDADLRAELFKKGIVEYIAKDSPVAVDHLRELLQFLIQQRGRRVLVVNKNSRQRQEQVRMLENLKLSAWACGTVPEALKLIASRENIWLALVGEELEDGEGLDLIQALRAKYPPSRLAIIAIPHENSELAAQYLRYGANDFLRQPYSPEEFQCRVRNTVQMQQQLHALELAATRDFLTQLLNRRAFFEAGVPLFAKTKRTNADLALAMIDIDHFKQINDKYGHDVGDQVLYMISQALASQTRAADIIARLGGEEFCILMPDVSAKDIIPLFDRYQNVLKNIDYSEVQPGLTVTVSVGISNTPTTSLDHMLKSADEALYEAKNTGRNRIVVH